MTWQLGEVFDRYSKKTYSLLVLLLNFHYGLVDFASDTRSKLAHCPLLVQTIQYSLDKGGGKDHKSPSTGAVVNEIMASV